jgi:hypothetical protein
MSRLPDRFDLFVRRARAEAAPERQIDLVLGALVARPALFFLNTATDLEPQVARTELEGRAYALVFTDAGRVEDVVAQVSNANGESRVITTPTAAALAWCVEQRVGLLVNAAGEHPPLLPPEAVADFVAEWQLRGAHQAAGFWIPEMTTEEEDFWQEHGL